MCNRPKRLPTVPLRIEELDIASARQFCDRIHEHHEPPLSGLFALAAWEGLLCVGVAIVGRPVARKFDNGSIAEVTRTATDGVRGACSLLVRAAGREALARGYRRIVSYTLLGETGACYRAARWRPTGITNNPNGWQSRPGRDDDGRQKGAKMGVGPRCVAAVDGGMENAPRARWQGRDPHERTTRRGATLRTALIGVRSPS